MANYKPCFSGPTLSVIVPVYGVEAYIADCIDSITSADGFAEYCELIIVDDGSPDLSMDIAMRRCAGLPNVTIIRQSNAGLGAARNAGLSRAQGQYIWFVDSDDEIRSECVGRLLECIQMYGPDIITFEFETISGVLGRPRYLSKFDTPIDPIDFLLSGRPPSPVQYYLFSKALLDRRSIKFEPGIYHEDALFTPLAIVSAKSIIRLPAVGYRYRMRPGSIMSQSNPARHLDDMMKVAEALAREGAACERTKRERAALAREVGFALGGVRYYCILSEPADRHRILPMSRLLAVGKDHWRSFSMRSLLNFLRLIIALSRDKVDWA